MSKTREELIASINELSKEQLAEIVVGVADWLWLDPETNMMDPDFEWDGADVLQEIANVMQQNGVTPEDEACSDVPGR